MTDQRVVFVQRAPDGSCFLAGMETTGIGDVETGMGIITDAREQMW